MTPEHLFEENIHLAAFFAKRYTSILQDCRDLDYNDALQEARIGLWEACKAYDPQKGALSTLAGIHIRNRFAHLASGAGRLKRRAQRTAASLNAPLSSEDEYYTLEDLLSSEDDPERNVILEALVKRLHKRVPLQTKKVLDLILIGYEPIEIADRLGVSKQMIHQHREKIRAAYVWATR